MQFFLAQEIPTSFLPLWAQVFLTLITLIAVIYSLRHSLALKEFAVIKLRCERLEKENAVLVDANTDLKVKTNLEPLVLAFNTWQAEARKNFQEAMARLEQIRSENIQAMQTGQTILIAIANKLGAENHGK